MKRGLFYFILCATLLGGAVGCGDDGGKDNPGTGPTPDKINLNVTHTLGIYEFNEFNEGLSNFYLALSDVKIEGEAIDPVLTGAGNVVALDMYVIASEEGVLPAGTYNYKPGVTVIEDFMLSEISTFGHANQSGVLLDENIYMFESVKLEITKSGNIYTINLLGKFDGGKAVLAKYTGELFFKKASGGSGEIFPPLKGDVQAAFIDSKTIYNGTTKSGAGHFSLMLFDYKNDEANHAGHMLVVELFSEVVGGSKQLAPGTYTVGSTFDSAKTYDVGQVQPGNGNKTTYIPEGSYCLNVSLKGDDFSMKYGFAKSGTVVVTKSGDTYGIAVDLVDVDGFAIKGDFNGKLTILDRSYYSTLKEDHEVNLMGTKCEIEYYGQAYAAEGLMADSWGVYLGTWEDKTEAIQLELLVPHGNFADGVPTGEYPVSITYDPSVSELVCIPGEMLPGAQMFCSWYLGAFQGGAAYTQAPFVSGMVLIENMGENMYTIMIDVMDDAPVPNNIFGDWDGEATMINKAKIAERRAPISAVGAQEHKIRMPILSTLGARRLFRR